MNQAIPYCQALFEESLRTDLYDGLFAEQRAFVEDKAKKVGAVCSRRAGKTWGVTRKILKVCEEKPGALVGYLTKTRDWAEELVWEPLQKLATSRGVADQKDFNNSKLRGILKNGSKIRLAGAKDKAQTEVLRGFGYDLIVIDEAGSIDPVIMRYVLKDVLPAALGEKRGQLVIVGTPNESCSGYFHDMATQKNSRFSMHHWTQRQNVEFPYWAGCDPKDYDRLVDQYLKEERVEFNFSETDAAYQREYMGLWAKNEELFIYRITQDNLRNPPDIPLRHVLALDIGFHDMTAWELLGYDQHDQRVYEVDSTQEQHLTFDDIAARTLKYAEDYELDCMVVDTAGAGKVVQDSLARELSARFQVPCKAAAKNKKGTNMKLLASDFRAGKAHLLPHGVCQDQLQSLQWNEHRLVEKDPQPGQFCDNADAYLYAYRECYHWLHEERPEAPPTDPIERATFEMAKQEEAELEMLEENNRKPWWEKR